MTRQDFAKIMAYVSVATGKSLSPEAAEVYYDLLGECGISTIEQEFLANIVMPNEITVGEWILDQALPAIKAGKMPPLMLAAPAKDIVEAEFEETKRPSP